MATNLGNQQFVATVRKWKQKVGARMEAFARACCYEMAERVVKATPVDTGFLKASWQPSIGAVPAGLSNGYDMSQIGLTISGLKLGDTFFLTNGAAYARRIEYGFVGQDSLGRNYNQPGRYFVTDNVKKWKSVVSHVANEFAKTMPK